MRAAGIEEDLWEAMLQSKLSDKVHERLIAYAQEGGVAERKEGESPSQYYVKLKLVLTNMAMKGATPIQRRTIFNSRVQQEGESVTDFGSALVTLVAQAYPTHSTQHKLEAIQTQFIAGLRDQWLQEKLYRKTPKTLQETLDKAEELEQAHLTMLANQKNRPQVNAIDGRQQDQSPKGKSAPAGRNGGGGYRGRGRGGGRGGRGASNGQTPRNGASSGGGGQAAAGTEGEPRKDERECWNCGQLGHIQRFCQAPPRPGSKGKDQQGSAPSKPSLN